MTSPQPPAPPQPAYRVVGEYVTARVSNQMGGSVRGLWLMRGFSRGAILPPDVHPDDIAHLLRTRTPGMASRRGGLPMIEAVEAGTLPDGQPTEPNALGQ